MSSQLENLKKREEELLAMNSQLEAERESLYQHLEVSNFILILEECGGK